MVVSISFPVWGVWGQELHMDSEEDSSAEESANGSTGDEDSSAEESASESSRSSERSKGAFGYQFGTSAPLYEVFLKPIAYYFFAIALGRSNLSGWAFNRTLSTVS